MQKDKKTFLRDNNELNRAKRLVGLGTWEFDLQAERLKWSEEIFRIFGRDPKLGEISYKEFLACLHRNDRRQLISTLKASLLDSSDFSLDLHVFLQNEKEVFVQANGECILDSERQVIGFAGVALDVTSRKLVEIALNEKNTVLENALEAIAVLDLDGKYVYCNKTYESISGYTAEDLVGKKSVETVFSEDADKITKAFQESIFKGRSEVEVRSVHKSGEIYYKRIAILLACRSDGSVHGYYKFVKDITEQKIASEAIKQQEQQLQTIINATRDGIWDWDLSSNQLMISPNGYKMLGLDGTSLELNYNDIYKMLHPEDREIVSQSIKRHLELHTPFVLDFRMRRGDGIYIWINARGQAIWDESGKPIRFLVSNTDITERKAAEEALKESEERFRMVINTTHDGIWDWNLITNEIYFSPTWYRLFGYEVNEFQPTFEETFSRIHEQDQALCAQAIEDHLQQGKPFKIEIRMRHKDGAERWVLSRGQALWNEEGVPYRFVGNLSDITDRKRSEVALKESEERLRMILAHLPIVLFLIDGEGKITFVEGKGAHFFNLDEKTLIGHQAEDYFAEIPLIQSDLMRSLQGSEVRNVREFKGYMLDIWYRPLLSPQGDIKQVIIAAVDITERMSAEKELEKANSELAENARKAKELAEKAEDANRAKSAFLAKMSHELRTPMNGVIGMTTLLLDMSLNSEQHECASTILSSANSLLALLNDILDLSKIEAGKMLLERSDFDLREVIEDVVCLFAPAVFKKGLDVEYLIPHNFPVKLIGDSSKIRQVLSNLIGNALKFTDQGKIKLEASLVAERETSLDVKISVSDTGIGIPQERQEEIFESFTQADDSTTRKFGGTGLGLTICRQMASLLGGTISVESEPGKGSTFLIFCIFEKQKDQGRERELFEKAKVLIATRKPEEKISRLLESWGVVVDSWDLSQESNDLSKLQKEKYTLLLWTIHKDFSVMEKMQEDYLKILKLSPLPIVTVYPSQSATNLTECNARRMLSVLRYPIRYRVFYGILSQLKEGGMHKKRRMFWHFQGSEEKQEILSANKCILLAEDNLVNQKVALKMLEKLSVTVVVANNGLEALEKFKERDFDIVLMDCQMPEMDGYTATKEIRAYEEETGKRTPVIALTANAMAGDRQFCLDTGMDDYIAKPIDKEKLYQTLNRWGNRDSLTEKTRSDLGQNDRHMELKESINVLLAEDNQVSAKVTEHMLKEFSRSIDIVKNGFYAVESFKKNNYDIILMDCQMPEMDGYVATTLIREKERGTEKHVPIIALTANVAEGDREWCLTLGMDDYLQKPIHKSELTRVLKKWTKLKDILSNEMTPSKKEVPVCLEELIAYFGNELDFAIEVVEEYLNSASKIFDELVKSIQSNDKEAIAFHAHSLKGSSRTIKADKLAELCQEIEFKARNGNEGSFDQYILILENAFTHLHKYLSQFASRKAA